MEYPTPRPSTGYAFGLAKFVISPSRTSGVAGSCPVASFIERRGEVASYFRSIQACASRAASVRIFCVFASGLNGLPFSMPIVFS